MPHVRAGGTHIWHEIVGSGPRLLYIGDTGGDLRCPPNASSPLKERFSDPIAYARVVEFLGA